MKKTLITLLVLTAYYSATSQKTFQELLKFKTMKQLHGIIDNATAVTGMMAIDLTTGESFGINEHEIFAQASAIKVPLLMEVYKQAGQKKFALTDNRSIKPTDVVAGSGIIQSLMDPSSFSIRNLCILMVSLSDNTATNSLIELVGMDAVNASLRSMGYTKTKLQRRMINQAASARGEENLSTPAEAAKLMQAIYKGEIVDKVTSDQILNILKTLPRKESEMAKTLPDDVPILFKDGRMPGVSTEWAIISLPGRPYAVTIMENFKWEAYTSHAMEQISAILYQYFWRLGNATKYGTYVDRALLK